MWVGTCIVCGEGIMLPICTKTEKCKEITTLIEELNERINDLHRDVRHIRDAVKDFEHDYLLYDEVRETSLDNLWREVKPEGNCDRSKFVHKQFQYLMAATEARRLFKPTRFNSLPTLSGRLEALLTRLKNIDKAEGWEVDYTLTPEQVIADDRTTS